MEPSSLKILKICPNFNPQPQKISNFEDENPHELRFLKPTLFFKLFRYQARGHVFSRSNYFQRSTYHKKSLAIELEYIWSHLSQFIKGL